MSDRGGEKRLAGFHFPLFGFPAGVSKLHLAIALKYRDSVRVAMHYRFLVRAVMDSEDPDLGIFKFDLVMPGIHLGRILCQH